MANSNSKKPIVVAVSGGFDPIHIGHVRLFKRAREYGDELVVILNNDHWLRKKKRHVFMPVHERKEIIEALDCVSRVIITEHEPNTADMSVSNALRSLRPDIFANGGDRHIGSVPELKVCEELGIKAIYNIGEGGKVQSSSWLLKKYLDSLNSPKES